MHTYTLTHAAYIKMRARKRAARAEEKEEEKEEGRKGEKGGKRETRQYTYTHVNALVFFVR